MKRMFYFMLSVSLVLTGCGSKGGNATNTAAPPKKETVINIALSSKPKSMDPHMYSEIYAFYVTKQIFKGLVENDAMGNQMPRIAESWEYITPTELVFNLRKGVKFHNGDEVTADDVVFSLERMKEKPGTRVRVEDIDTVEKIDDYKVKLNLKKPSAPLLYNLGMDAAAIMNKKYTLAKGEDISIEPLGVGPFKFVSWGNGEKIELEAFDDYFLGRPKSDKLIMRTMVEASSRVAALETGEIDIANNLSPVDMVTVKNHSNLTLVSEPTYSTDYLTVNQKKQDLQVKEIRQAIHYAMDKQGMTEAIFSGAAVPAKNMVNLAVWGYSEDFPQYEYNPEKAKELLKKIGRENDVKLKIWTNDNQTRIQVAQIVQSNLKDVGIEAAIEVLEWGAILQRSAQGEHDLLLLGWSSGEIDNVFFPLLHTKSHGVTGNRAFYSNKDLDSLIEAGREEVVPEKRKEIYKQAQTILSDEAPLIPLYYKNENIGLNKKVKGFKYNPGMTYDLSSLYKE